MATQVKVREFAQLMLRMPPGLRERIAEAAEQAGRSMNAEVLARLEASFENDDLTREHDARIYQLENRILLHEHRLDRLEDRADWSDGTAMRRQERD